MISNNDMVMPVAPMIGGYGSGSGFTGDWSSWIILFLIFAMFGNGGWGNNGGGANGNVLYPWLNQSNQVNDGFRDQMINSTINGIQSSVTTGFGDVQTSLCSGFAGVNAAINGAQMANLERSFAAQTATSQGLSAVQSQLAQNNYNNGTAIADLKYTVATENCADRTAAASNTRDIIDATNRTGQAILDKLCALELDGYKRENDNLRTQLNMANLAASQTAQTAQILAGQSAEIDGVYNRLKNCPVGTYSVCNPNIYPGQNCGCSYGLAA